MIDVHIIKGNDEPYLKNCLDSLEWEDVTIWFEEKIEGNSAKARENGFSKGAKEYVSFVDPDDEVVPGIFDLCIKVLKSNPWCNGVYTDEILIDKDGNYLMDGWSINEEPFKNLGYRKELMRGIHHLCVFKREIVEKCLPLKTNLLSEPILINEILSYGPLIHIPLVGYKWRIHGENTFSKLSKEQIDEAEKIARDVGSVQRHLVPKASV